jgi:hypothetical protein
MKSFVRILKPAFIASFAVLLTACSGGSSGGSYSGGGGSSSTYGPHSSSYASASGFVDALNDVDNAAFPYDNYIVKDQYDTIRNDEDFFVIGDEEYQENVGVSLQYLRSIVYYSYYSSNYNLADEFRDVQADDEYFTGLIGDGYGNDYEIVDYYGSDSYGDPVYVGYDSGLFYEDEQQTYDVSLMSGEAEGRAFYEKAAKVSLAYSVGIETSLALVTLGDKVEKMLDKTNGEITLQDQMALVSDLEHMTGVSLQDVNEAAKNPKAKSDLVQRVADKIGTTSSNLEQRILPDVFGLEL